MATPRPLRRWDVFCRVVDHYGDAGVCLRVARALATAPGRDVRLWVDRPEVALALIDPRPEGHAASGWRDRSGVRIGTWNAAHGGDEGGAEDGGRDANAATRTTPGATNAEGVPATALPDVVVETFGGDLPADVLGAMRTAQAAGKPTPVWLNLDYLSAEDWGEGCHGLPSPQPGGLTRWFVFPGFTARTAGLPGPLSRLPDLPKSLAGLMTAAHAPSAPPRPASENIALGTRAAAAKGATGTDATALLGSVFCYRDSPLPALLDAMQHGPRDVRLLVPAGMPGDLGGRPLGLQTGATWHGDRLTLVRTPFVDQDVYDALLADCDFNLVRGEDSFVRAQWAARPLLWAAYRQAEDAHHAKVEAWLARSAMPPAWAALTRWFNGDATAKSSTNACSETHSLPIEKPCGASAPASSGTPDIAAFADQPATLSPDVADLWHAALAELEATRAWSATWRDQLLALPRIDEAIAEFASRHASEVQ
ncbi:MAG: elongation factor P maturation arginine rhamnosyltransferase EarP [Rhodocyclaceae bacterium]|nr:elongation factor P maturation arginine rhamnosyltransferase EarP [Rhodocyclaceae bacterium]